jgi:hypothetical protein
MFIHRLYILILYVDYMLVYVLNCSVNKIDKRKTLVVKEYLIL